MFVLFFAGWLISSGHPQMCNVWKIAFLWSTSNFIATIKIKWTKCYWPGFTNKSMTSVLRDNFNNWLKVQPEEKVMGLNFKWAEEVKYAESTSPQRMTHELPLMNFAGWTAQGENLPFLPLKSWCSTFRQKRNDAIIDIFQIIYYLAVLYSFNKNSNKTCAPRCQHPMLVLHFYLELIC